MWADNNWRTNRQTVDYPDSRCTCHRVYNTKAKHKFLNGNFCYSFDSKQKLIELKGKINHSWTNILALTPATDATSLRPIVVVIAVVVNWGWDRRRRGCSGADRRRRGSRGRRAFGAASSGGCNQMCDTILKMRNVKN
jgi:hypothetical protein